MTKRQKPFNPYGTFTMPRSLDGFSRTATEFVPAVLICHRGQTHQDGHYFAILIYRDLMWLADDGQVPTHLPNLTPSLASQITQVWAVNIDCFKTPQQVLQGLPPPEEPDFEPPLHPSPLKRARLEQQHNILHFGNANRSLNGTGHVRAVSTSLLKLILISNGAMSFASTSASEAAQSSAHLRNPTRTTLGHMVGCLFWQILQVD